MEEKEFENEINQENTEEPVEAAAAEAAEEALSEAPAKAAPAEETLSEAPAVAAPAEEALSEAPAPKDPDDTMSLDEMPQEETGALTEEDIFSEQEVKAADSEAHERETFEHDTETVNGSFAEQSTHVGQESYSGPESYAESGSYNGSGSYSDAARAYSYAAPSAGYQAAAHHHPGYITKKAFVIILIIAMLLTMLASVGITTAYTTYLNSKTNANGHATNYTLTTSDESLSYKSIIEKTQDSVVSITTESLTNDMWMQNYVTQGAGSGVIIQSDGYIITCEHVISGARKITVTLRDGKEYEAEIIGADADNDIAVIKIDAKNLQEATYGDSSKLEVGDQVVAIGNPLGTLSGTATTGIISALNRNLTIDNRTLNLFQTDASINPGNSGGGMFDASGNLIGIVEAKSTGSDIDGLGFATPINKAAKIAKQIIKTGSDVKSNGKSGSSNQSVIIGIMVAPVDSNTAKEYGYSHGGLLIKQVTSEEANMAGLQAGDIIFEADGKTITTNEDLSKVLSKKKEGDTVKLSIARENGFDSVITTKLISSGTTH